MDRYDADRVLGLADMARLYNEILLRGDDVPSFADIVIRCASERNYSEPELQERVAFELRAFWNAGSLRRVQNSGS